MSMDALVQCANFIEALKLQPKRKTMSDGKQRYSHLYSVGFSVISFSYENASALELIQALEHRLQDLKNLPEDEVLEAFENLDDTCSIDDINENEPC